MDYSNGGHYEVVKSDLINAWSLTGNLPTSGENIDLCFRWFKL